MGLQLYDLQSQGQPKPLAFWPWASSVFNFLWSLIWLCCASADQNKLDQMLNVPHHREGVQGKE